MIFASWCREGSGRWKHGQVSDTQYVFALEPYTDGTPAPTVVTKEVDRLWQLIFYWLKPDFSKTEVVKVYVGTIVAPAMDYWKQTIEDKKWAQLE